MKFPRKEDQRKIILAAALTDISGLKATPVDALKVFKALPDTILAKMWISYRANLPNEGYYTSTGLYEAPGTVTHRKRFEQDTQSSPAAGMLRARTSAASCSSRRRRRGS